jgi:hypothetical protein
MPIKVGKTEYADAELDALYEHALNACAAARSLSMQTADGLTQQAMVDLLSAAQRALGQTETLRYLAKKREVD